MARVARRRIKHRNRRRHRQTMAAAHIAPYRRRAGGENIIIVVTKWRGGVISRGVNQAAAKASISIKVPWRNEK